jgi:hypothetical protein
MTSPPIPLTSSLSVQASELICRRSSGDVTGVSGLSASYIVVRLYLECRRAICN